MTRIDPSNLLEQQRIENSDREKDKMFHRGRLGEADISNEGH